MNKTDKKIGYLNFTLDKQITLGFLGMLILIIFVSSFCVYTINKLKDSRTEIDGEPHSLYQIIEKSADETVFDNEMLMEAIEFADKEIGIAYLNVVIISLISIFFGGLITLLFPKKVTKPVFKLIEATKEAQKGDYSYRVPNIEGSNEISMLITSFNNMLEQIEESNTSNEKLLEKTKDFNNKLESKVKKIEKELMETNTELAKNERLAEIGQIVFKIAHEIKNPLSGISIALENLSDETENDEFKQTIKEIIVEIKRLDNIVKELFQIALPTELDLVEVNPSEIINKALNIVQYKKNSDENNVLIERQYLSHDHNLKLKLDRDQIQQVLINLIINAVDSVDSKNGKIIIDTENNKENFEILISDNGRGITDKDVIFQPFYTTKKDGSGLGLPISQTIIDKHKGELVVKDNDNGIGTLFIIKLPNH